MNTTEYSNEPAASLRESQPVPKGNPKFPIAFIGILLVCACLTMVCLCFPIFLLPALWTQQGIPFGWEAPTGIPVLPSDHPTVSPQDFPTCVNKLTRVLYEASHTYLDGVDLDTRYFLITYTVSGDTLSDAHIPAYLLESVKPFQQDLTTPQQIWQFIVDIVPADQRREVSNFVIYTDGIHKTLGAVQMSSDDPRDWMLEIDIQDSKTFPLLSTTVIHEFAHLLTLNASQVKVNILRFYNPDRPDIYETQAASCNTYFTSEGCSYPTSYINTFFQQFWQPIYIEWQAINAIEDEQVQSDQLDSFYLEYANQFVSRYAVTNPKEDIAESFNHFIFTRKPTGNSIADQKVLFFYDYPEIVTLREQILANLCAYLDTP